MSKSPADYFKRLNNLERWSDALRVSVEKGQTPETLYIHFGSGGPYVLNVGPNEAFGITASDPVSLKAAINYGGHHVHTKQSVIYLADKDLDDPKGVDKALVRDIVKTDRRRAAFTLLAEMAKKVAVDAHGPIAGLYQTADGVEYALAGSADEMMRGAKVMKGSYADFGFETKATDTLSCGCCDSRAQRGHLFCENPGETYGDDRIACIASSEIVGAAKAGGLKKVRLEVHSSCGGVNGLVNWILNNASPGPALEAYLGQVKDSVETFFKTLGKSLKDDTGAIKAETFRAAEMWIGQKAAQKYAEALGRGNVELFYFDIKERKVYPLNADASAEETWANAVDPSRLKNVGEVSDSGCCGGNCCPSKEFPKRKELREAVFELLKTKKH